MQVTLDIDLFESIQLHPTPGGILKDHIDIPTFNMSVMMCWFARHR